MSDKRLLSIDWLKNSVNDVDDLILKSLYSIKSPAGDGTGFLLDSGYIVTCAHVVGNCNGYDLKVHNNILNSLDTPYTTGLSINKIIIDNQRDLAYLVPDKINIEYALTLGDECELKIGDKLKTWGFPFGTEGPDGGITPLLTICYLSGFSSFIIKSDDKSTNDQFFKYLVINGIISKGNSGGPLFKYGCNQVIGVNVNKSVMPFDPLKKILEDNHHLNGNKIDDIFDSKQSDMIVQRLDDLIQIMIGKAISASEIKTSIKEQKL